MTRIRIADLRPAGICPKVRHWAEARGLDWRAFVRDGIPVEELRALGEHGSAIDRLETAAKARERRGCTHESR